MDAMKIFRKILVLFVYVALFGASTASYAAKRVGVVGAVVFENQCLFL